MKTKPISPPKRVVWMTLAVLLLGAMGFGFQVYRKPNFEISLIREVTAKRSAEQIAQMVGDPPAWRGLFRNFTQAEIHDGLFILELTPKKRKNRAFKMEGRLIESQTSQEKVYKWEFTKLPTKIDHLFQSLTYTLKLSSSSERPTLEVSVVAFTKTFRSRLLGTLLPRIILNQVLYLDLDLAAGVDPLPSMGYLP